MVFKLKYDAETQGAAEVDADTLSVGGVSFRTTGEVPIGTVLNLDFSIEGLAGEIKARGKVVRSWNVENLNFAAIEFTDIDDSDLEIIKDFIDSYLKEIVNY